MALSEAPSPPHTLDHPPWSSKRWAVSILAAFAVQALILMYLSRHQSDDPPTVPLRMALHLVADPWSSQQLALMQTYRDPTLFALPNVNSFSGAGWLKFHPMEHHFVDWNESPPWLGVSEQDLGASFHEYIARSASSPLRIADKPLSPRLGTELLVPNLALADESTVQLQGDLQRHLIEPPPKLRSWHHSDILSNTVVRVVVDTNSQIFSVSLTQSCGLPDADLYALNFAQTARLKPRPSAAQDSPSRLQSTEKMAWGYMVFQWHTLPPQDGTEPPSSTPSSTP